MSPTRKPSTVAGLRRGLGPLPSDSPAEIGNAIADLPVPAKPAGHIKPARVTLNLPPQLFRDLSRWADDSAADLNVPRVGIQDAMRAMIAVTVADKGIGAEVREHIRRARA